MDALVVLALGVDDLYGLVLAHEHAIVTYLAAHLAIEGSVVEYQFIEAALLLCHLAVAQDVAFVFSIVVTDKLLVAFLQHLPVAVLHGGGVAGTCLLLLHLFVELLLVYGVTVLTANQLGQVEWESVGVEEAECAHAVQFGQAVRLQFVHVAIEEVDAFLQRAEERILFLFHYACDKLLLGWQLGECSAHLLYQYVDELIHERLFLVEECVGVTHGTAQDTADDIAGLGIAWQLAVGDGECHGAQMVCADTHGDVNLLLLVLALAVLAGRCSKTVFLARECFDFLDDGLEDIRVIVGVLVLQHAHQAFEAHTCIDDVH